MIWPARSRSVRPSPTPSRFFVHHERREIPLDRLQAISHGPERSSSFYLPSPTLDTRDGQGSSRGGSGDRYILLQVDLRTFRREPSGFCARFVNVARNRNDGQRSAL